MKVAAPRPAGQTTAKVHHQHIYRDRATVKDRDAFDRCAGVVGAAFAVAATVVTVTGERATMAGGLRHSPADQSAGFPGEDHMASSNPIDQVREMMVKRLAEIELERDRLSRALAELGGKAKGSPGRRRGKKPASASPTASAPATPRKRRRIRRGTIADKTVELVEKTPGVSASDIARKMKMKPNYLYRVLGDLEKEGRVRKDGRRYHPAG